MTPLDATFVFFTLGNLLVSLAAVYQSRGMEHLDAIDASPPSPWPRVTVIVPACNEEGTIEGAVNTLLGIDYPDIELIVINDRSTDETGAILDRLSTGRPELRILHLDHLPEGWLGKLHAMHVGAEAATGSFLVFADADVHHGPDGMRKSVAWAERDSLDLIALIPRMEAGTASVGAAINSFGAMFMLGARPRAVNTDVPGAYAGVGAFTLVRKSTFERTEGWPWLRLEVADDLGLGLLIHRHGGRGRIAHAHQDLALTWYATLPSMVRGMEKNSFAAIARFSVVRALMISGVTTAAAVAPFLLLGTAWWPLSVTAMALTFLGPILGKSAPVPPGSRILSLFGGPVLGYILLRSAWQTKRRGAISWRGTEYPLDELKKHQRVVL